MKSVYPIVSIALVMFLYDTVPAEDRPVQPGQQTSKSAEETEIAKKTENPLSDIIMVPIQYNYAPSVDPVDKSATQILIEPTFPIRLHDKWSIFTHIVIPYVALPEVEGGDKSTGWGNILATFDVSPRTGKKFTWGIGAGLMIPTATDTNPISLSNTPSGVDCWAAGPSVVFIYKSGPWVTGVLFNQFWSFAASAGTKLNQMQIQGKLFYNLGRGFSLGYVPLIRIDWDESASQSTTLPVGLQFGKVFLVSGVLSIGIGVGGYYNAIRPDTSAEYIIRGQLLLVFPESLMAF
jgi:hypothetical protein